MFPNATKCDLSRTHQSPPELNFPLGKLRMSLVMLFFQMSGLHYFLEPFIVLLIRFAKFHSKTIPLIFYPVTSLSLYLMLWQFRFKTILYSASKMSYFLSIAQTSQNLTWIFHGDKVWARFPHLQVNIFYSDPQDIFFSWNSNIISGVSGA